MVFHQILIGKKSGMKINNKAPEGGALFLTNLRESLRGSLMSNIDLQRAKNLFDC